jgi:hypothetical protein
VAVAIAPQTESLEGLSTAALGKGVVGMRREIDRLEAECSRWLAEFDRRQGYLSHGASSTVDWLKRECGLPGAAAAQRAEVARELPALAGAVEAFRSGEIGYHQAAVLARTVTEIGREAAGQAAPGLVAAAERVDADRLRTMSRELRHCVDPEGALAASLRDHERRRFRLSQSFDGVYLLDGQLDGEGGALLRTAIEALTAPLPRDQRTSDQRRADALVELARRQLQGGSLPGSGGQRPHLMVTVPAAALSGRAGEGVAAVVHVGPISTAAARRHACDAAVSVVSLGPDGSPVAASRTTRTVSPSQRRALEARDGGCAIKGCGLTPSWCDAHHRTHWADFGPTELWNLLLLCRAHHRVAHEVGARLEPVGDGSFLIRPP